MPMCCWSGGNHAGTSLLSLCFCLDVGRQRLLLLSASALLAACSTTTAPQHQAACRNHATVCAAQRATSWMQSASGATINVVEGVEPAGRRIRPAQEEGEEQGQRIRCVRLRLDGQNAPAGPGARLCGTKTQHCAVCGAQRALGALFCRLACWASAPLSAKGAGALRCPGCTRRLI